MPSRPRIKDAGLLRHIVSRGTGRMRIFLDDTDRHRFLFLLREVVVNFNLECHDFCVMSTHFHLSILNRERNLSEAMQTLKSEYACAWNARHRRTGHVFEGPFRDQIVQRSTYARALTRYIAQNPCRAGMVQSPEDWPWSSCRFIAGHAVAPDFLATRRVLELFEAANESAARIAYLDHVRTEPAGLSGIEAFRSRQRVLGDPQFKRGFGFTEPSRGRKSVRVGESPEVTLGDITAGV